MKKYGQKELKSSFALPRNQQFPVTHMVKNVCNVGDLDSIPWSGRSPGEENGKLLQYSFLGNPMDRGAWQATVHGVVKSWTQWSN